MPTICVFGDSIARGHSDYKNGGWVNQLRHYFDNGSRKHSIYNCGVSGDCTKDLLVRFKTEAEARDAEIVIFAVGINDAYYMSEDKSPNVDLKDFEENLNELVKQAGEILAEVVFMGLTKVNDSKLQPCPWRTEISYNNEKVREYDEVIKQVCSKNNLPFIDINSIFDPNDLDEDGLHPDTEGHVKIFYAIKEFLAG